MTMIQPRRFQFTAEQLATALALSGISPTSRANLPDLPSPAKSERGLKSAGVLSDGGGLHPDVKSALLSVADPTLVVLVMANRAGQRDWAQTTIVRGGPDQPFVVQALSGKAFDFAVLGSLTAATVTVDAMLDLTAFGVNGTRAPVDLDLGAFGALMAAADVVQETRLQAWLDRDPELSAVVLTSQLLEEQLARGLAGQDTRWAVTAAMVAGPAGLSSVAGGMAAGLEGLRAAKLVQSGTGGYLLTDAGRDLAFAFGKLVTSGSLSLGLAAPGQAVAIAHLSSFRTPVSIWLASWSGLAESTPTVRLWSPPAETAIRIVRGLLDPPPPSAGPAPATRPAAAGATPPAPAGARTTSRPRAATRTPAPATRTTRQTRPPQPSGAPPVPTAPERPAAAAPSLWTPTHRVLAGGAQAWERPDASLAPAAVLDAGLEVQLVEEATGWGHVVCSNTWEAWVDVRYLESLDS